MVMNVSDSVKESALQIWKSLSDVERRMLKDGSTNSNIIDHISNTRENRIELMNELMRLANG